MYLKKKKILLLVFVGSLLLIGGYYAVREPKNNGSPALAGKEVLVYKTPTCGCCGAFVSYLQKKGVAVKVEVVKSLSDAKLRSGVSSELSSCHTTIIDGYVVEGHVPIEAMQKLIDEKPAIKGIALPGMPSGTPGMPGPKNEEWNIRSFTEDGTIGTFTTI